MNLDIAYYYLFFFKLVKLYFKFMLTHATSLALMMI